MEIDKRTTKNKRARETARIASTAGFGTALAGVVKNKFAADAFNKSHNQYAHFYSEVAHAGTTGTLHEMGGKLNHATVDELRTKAKPIADSLAKSAKSLRTSSNMIKGGLAIMGVSFVAKKLIDRNADKNSRFAPR